MKMKMSDNDLKFVLLFGILLFGVVFYFVGFQMFLKDASEVRDTNQTLQAQVDELELKQAQKGTVEAETKQYEADTSTIVAQFPEKVTTEKIISDLVDLEDATGNSRISSASFVMNNQFYPEADGSTTGVDTDGDGVVDEEAEDQPGYEDGVIKVYQSQSEISIENLSYEGLKKLVQFTNDYSGRLTIEELKMQFDSTTGNLTGTVKFNFYSLLGSPTKYEEPKITSVDLGLKDIFGTFQSSSK